MGLKFWHPDTCPAAPGCIIEIDASGGLVGFSRLCAFHAQAIGLGELALFTGVLAKNREKNKAQHVAAEAIGVRNPDDPAHFVLPDWRVNYRNEVRIRAVVPDEAERQRVQDAVDAAVGVGKVMVERRAAMEAQ